MSSTRNCKLVNGLYVWCIVKIYLGIATTTTTITQLYICVVVLFLSTAAWWWRWWWRDKNRHFLFSSLLFEYSRQGISSCCCLAVAVGKCELLTVSGKENNKNREAENRDTRQLSGLCSQLSILEAFQSSGIWIERERERGWDKRERETLGQEEEEANNQNLFWKKEPVSCVFGKNDWLIKIRYTGSGSKEMNAAVALLSVCLCVTRPTYLAGQIILKIKRITKKRNRTLISLFFFFLSFFFTGSCLSLNSHRGENNESLFWIAIGTLRGFFDATKWFEQIFSNEIHEIFSFRFGKKKMGSRSSLDLMSSNGPMKKDTVFFFWWVGGWAVVWVACGSHERIGEGDREGNARQLSLCKASL